MKVKSVNREGVVIGELCRVGAGDSRDAADSAVQSVQAVAKMEREYCTLDKAEGS